MGKLAIRPDVEMNLFDVIAEETADSPIYCGECYWEWEEKVATPLLEAAGHRVVLAYTGDGDSFGPLTRIFVTIKDGVRYELMYG